MPHASHFEPGYLLQTQSAVFGFAPEEVLDLETPVERDDLVDGAVGEEDGKGR